MFTMSELYLYASSVRRGFFEKLESLPWDAVTKNREASYHSMKNIFVHMIDNENWIVNWAIHSRSKEATRVKGDDFATMAQLKEYYEEVERKTKAYLRGADENEMKRRVDFVLSSGRSFNMAVEECLFQSFNEQLYHMGELIALLWQENIEPPRMQWFWHNPRLGEAGRL